MSKEQQFAKLRESREEGTREKGGTETSPKRTLAELGALRLDAIGGVHRNRAPRPAALRGLSRSLVEAPALWIP